MREQDFGNFQKSKEEMEQIWEERAHYGHFFIEYRMEKAPLTFTIEWQHSMRHYIVSSNLKISQTYWFWLHMGSGQGYSS